VHRRGGLDELLQQQHRHFRLRTSKAGEAPAARQIALRSPDAELMLLVDDDSER